MNKEKLELVRKTIKELEKDKIGVLDIDIVYELDCQLGYPDNREYNLNDEDYLKLYCEIEYAYLKTEGVAIESIVRCALDHKEDIMNDNEEFNLREESCWY